MNDNKGRPLVMPVRWISKEEALERWPTPKAIRDFTRVCEQTGLIDKLRKDEP